nr:helicase-related protein [Chitinophaga sedimenti]
MIIDEAHHNAFQKLLHRFPKAIVVGVTATPLSSNADLPMNKTYQQLIIGESIDGLIRQGYLAKPVTWRYDVELNSLKTGVYGDFTISTSDELYSSRAMLDLLLHAYETHSKHKKTLIFNNGIFTSRNVCKLFEEAGYPVKHLDNRHTPQEREDILKWFKRPKAPFLLPYRFLPPASMNQPFKP